MLGAIFGDIVGSIYEVNNIKSKKFPLFSEEAFFTDDTVLTVATMDKLLTNKSYEEVYREYVSRYPNRGYGKNFYRWATKEIMKPYNSYGNGSSMRVSPVAWAYNSLEEVVIEATKSAAITHNHPEGIKGAVVIASSVFLLRKGIAKLDLAKHIESEFGYNLSFTLESIRENYQFDPSCQSTVPISIVAFIESDGFEDSIRNAISVGGDSDTIADMTGALSEAFYGMQVDFKDYARRKMDEPLNNVANEFYEVFCSK